MKKNILITGGLGLLGKGLVNFLKNKKKYKLFVLNKSKSQRKNKLISGKEISFVYGNFQNKKLIKDIIKKKKINIIFHTGATTQVLDALKYPYQTYLNNILGTVNILESIKEIDKSILFIYSSSDKAYEKIKGKTNLEKDNLASIYPYYLSKKCSDLICQSYAKVFKLNVAIVRCVNLYGPGDFNLKRIIPETIISLINNKSLQIRSSGKLRRDYLYVDDAVNAYYLIMKKLEQNNINRLLIYNVSSINNLSVIQLFSIISNLMNKKNVKPIITNKSKKENNFQKLNDSKIKKELGWKQKISITKGLKNTITWYQKNYSLIQNKKFK